MSFSLIPTEQVRPVILKLKVNFLAVEGMVVGFGGLGVAVGPDIELDGVGLGVAELGIAIVMEDALGVAEAPGIELDGVGIDGVTELDICIVMVVMEDALIEDKLVATTGVVVSFRSDETEVGVGWIPGNELGVILGLGLDASDVAVASTVCMELELSIDMLSDIDIMLSDIEKDCAFVSKVHNSDIHVKTATTSIDFIFSPKLNLISDRRYSSEAHKKQL